MMSLESFYQRVRNDSTQLPNSLYETGKYKSHLNFDSSFVPSVLWREIYQYTAPNDDLLYTLPLEKKNDFNLEYIVHTMRNRLEKGHVSCDSSSGVWNLDRKDSVIESLLRFLLSDIPQTVRFIKQKKVHPVELEYYFRGKNSTILILKIREIREISHVFNKEDKTNKETYHMVCEYGDNNHSVSDSYQKFSTNISHQFYINMILYLSLFYSMDIAISSENNPKEADVDHFKKLSVHIDNQCDILWNQIPNLFKTGYISFSVDSKD